MTHLHQHQLTLVAQFFEQASCSFNYHHYTDEDEDDVMIQIQRKKKPAHGTKEEERSEHEQFLKQMLEK